MIVDKLGRRFRNLRVSLTAACNYACTYCVPDGKRLVPAKNEMPATDLLKAVKLLQQAAGIDKLRITGGEPLVTPKFDDFLLGVMQLPLEDVSLTTNGQLLGKKRAVIRESGIKRINVSLDTLNPMRFKQIARGGDLHTVLENIDAMLEDGVRLKINMVPLRTQNQADVLAMLDYCLERGIELRYIELMRMGHLATGNGFQADFLSMAALLDIISEKYEFARTDAPYDSTAARFQIPGAGVFGIIANESEPFCRTCTRLRLSSDCYLYGCLSNSRRHSMQALLDLPSYQSLPKLQNILMGALADKQLAAFQGETTVMKFIGG
jgi:GTP 3',8-cyclase